MLNTSFYAIKILDIHNQSLDLGQFKGKKILVVNVASECGYTPQYAQLEELYKAYGEKLVIIGCPSNDFGGQEPGSPDQIISFCQKNYGVTFPLTQKVNITKEPHVIYQWLCNKSLNGVSDNEVKWNFHKFLLDENGTLIASFPSSVNPMSEEIIGKLN